jgi:predicted CXXCH cytochrome family protein
MISIWAILVGLAVASGGVQQQAAQAQEMNTCVDCHMELPDPTLSDPVRQFQGDVHNQRGLSCVSCHGGDATQSELDRAMDPRKHFVGSPGPKDTPMFCGKCHSDPALMKKYNPAIRVDQVSEYATSTHGKLAAKGDSSVARCSSCHGSHGIRQVKDPNSPVYPTKVADTCGRCHGNADYMRPYSIPTDQLQKYRSSVHAETLLNGHDLSAPTCNSCHGNHGAAPPGVTSVANVCGTCHSRQSELFQKSPHGAAFDALGIGQCLACHSNHDVRHATDELLGIGQSAICIKCHEKGDDGFEAARVMRQHVDELATQAAQARTLLDRAARAGMEVSRAKFDLTGAQDKLIDARVVVHSFSPDDVTKVTKSGLDIAMKAHLSGEQALQELQFRRKGLAASLVFILAAILSIHFKLRQIERREQARINKSDEELSLRK